KINNIPIYSPLASSELIESNETYKSKWTNVNQHFCVVRRMRLTLFPSKQQWRIEIESRNPVAILQRPWQIEKREREREKEQGTHLRVEMKMNFHEFLLIEICFAHSSPKINNIPIYSADIISVT
uniref:Uncharacterized protein n=1 Tax=Strigamia maritima TaxID=126957 RepID=T1JEP5_STRMM